MAKYVFVTGGVVSGLGKGITASSIALLLKSRGYKYATIGVEKNNKIAKDIYLRYGFTEYLKDSVEYYPDGTKVELEYYRKEL